MNAVTIRLHYASKVLEISFNNTELFFSRKKDFESEKDSFPQLRQTRSSRIKTVITRFNFCRQFAQKRREHPFV